jgi:hypothetical protein
MNTQTITKETFLHFLQTEKQAVEKQLEKHNVMLEGALNRPEMKTIFNLWFHVNSVCTNQNIFVLPFMHFVLKDVIKDVEEMETKETFTLAEASQLLWDETERTYQVYEYTSEVNDETQSLTMKLAKLF